MAPLRNTELWPIVKAKCLRLSGAHTITSKNLTSKASNVDPSHCLEGHYGTVKASGMEESKICQMDDKMYQIHQAKAANWQSQELENT